MVDGKVFLVNDEKPYWIQINKAVENSKSEYPDLGNQGNKMSVCHVSLIPIFSGLRSPLQVALCTRRGKHFPHLPAPVQGRPSLQ